jgi:Flp pilus assembly protein TadD
MTEPPRNTKLPSPQEDLAGSDFLFHLYRGAELLQENQVHEAKSEIENALQLQPREPQGQDLLAQVYFRLGLYPRSIAIYESLATSFPEEITPRINLALCYLKTGQPDRAREQLERVVTTEPARQRAWGYLGLAFERLGAYEKARAAFDRAGYASMARRMDALLDTRPEESVPIPDEPNPGPDLTELRSIAEAAFHELDASDDAFSLALPAQDGATSDPGAWFEVALGRATVEAPQYAKAHAPPAQDKPPERSEPSEPPPARRPADACSVATFARASTLVFPRGDRCVRAPGGSVLVSLDAEFATRIDLVQAFACYDQLVAREYLPRERGGDPSTPLGGSSRPLVIVDGARRLVLSPRKDRELHGVVLEDDGLFVREDCLAAFDRKIAYDHGRLASGYGDTISLVHLHGAGLAVLDLPAGCASVEVTGHEGCVLRCASLIGWVGRVVARCLPVVDAPAAMRGWAACSGEGTVLFDPARETLF